MFINYDEKPDENRVTTQRNDDWKKLSSQSLAAVKSSIRGIKPCKAKLFLSEIPQHLPVQDDKNGQK